MSRSNEIVAYFKGTTGVAESVYQYDSGMVLVIDGLILPQAFEAHFAKAGDDDSITVIGADNRVAIPDDYLLLPGVVTVYIYQHSGQNDGEVGYVVRFNVINRARPTASGTEAERDEMDSAVSQAIALFQNEQKINTPMDGYNQVDHGTPGQLLRTKGNGATEWADYGLPTDEQTAQAISTWLDAHPEATTTVEDGSLTEPKFSDALKLKAIKDYVTPEMFGAKGDGITDDSTALQSAIDSGKPIILLGTYLTNSALHFTNSILSVSNGGVKVTTALFIEGDNITVDGVTFDGALSSPYIKCVGNHFRINNCTFKNFSGNESYKFTRSLWMGEDDNDHYDNIISNCTFDGAYTDYENGVIGDVQGSVHQIYVCRSETVVEGCNFKNLEGREDGDIIQIASEAATNSNYPYNQNGNLEFSSLPCIVSHNVFYCDECKSAVKVMASDVDVSDNVMAVRYTDGETYLNRYIVRGYNCNNVSVCNNQIKINGASLNSIFDLMSCVNAKLCGNMVIENSSTASVLYTRRNIVSLKGVVDGVIDGNQFIVKTMNNIITPEFSIAKMTNNMITFTDDIDETIYCNKWYTRTLITTGLPNNIGLLMAHNTINIIGSRKKMRIETGAMGNFWFYNNDISGTLTDDLVDVYCITDVAVANNIMVSDVPFGLAITHSASENNSITFTFANNKKFLGCNLYKVGTAVFKNNDISSTYQAITLNFTSDGAKKVVFDGNYVHDITNALFRIMTENPSIDISNSTFVGMTLAKIVNSYNNSDFQTKSVYWHKNNIGNVDGVNTGATDSTQFTRDCGDVFYNSSAGKLKMYDSYGYLNSIS